MLGRYEEKRNATKNNISSLIPVLIEWKTSREGYLAKRLVQDKPDDIIAAKKRDEIKHNIKIIKQFLLQLEARLDQEDFRKIQNVLEGVERELYSGHARDLIRYVISIHRNSSSQPVNKISHLDLERIKMDERMVKKLLERKIDPKIFIIKHAIKINDDIAKHAAWAFNHIYSIPYPYHKQFRYIHGIQHVSRVAIYVSVFANLFAKHGDKDAQGLSSEDLKLLQIAALFHDSARMGEEKDLWDNDSAEMLYLYLHNVLSVSHERAVVFAEAIANKDKIDNLPFYNLRVHPVTHCIMLTDIHSRKKNIFEKILHDADCLDIIRARDHFDATHFDFYQYIAKDDNALALHEMARLITEARSLIEIHGDTRNLTIDKIKRRYENESCYQMILDNDIPSYLMLRVLGSGILSVAQLARKTFIWHDKYNPEHGASEKNICSAMWEGKLFARGIGSPSAISQKPLKSGADETLVELEIRKTLRRNNTTKPEQQKHGNPDRSISMLSYGSGVFSPAGFLLVNPSPDKISEVSDKDCDSGFAKKEHLRMTKTRAVTNHSGINLISLHERLKLGGVSRKYEHLKRAVNHTEVLCHISDFDAVYYTNDPNLYNEDSISQPFSLHRNSSLLQAVFIQNQYAKQSNGKLLPIYKYSGVHNRIRLQTNLDESQLKSMWAEMCYDYMNKQMQKTSTANQLLSMSINDIKTLSMSLKVELTRAKFNASADSNYSPSLQLEISQTIEAIKLKLVKKYANKILGKFHDGALVIDSPEMLALLLNYPSYANKLEGKIEDYIRKAHSQSWRYFQIDSCEIGASTRYVKLLGMRGAHVLRLINDAEYEKRFIDNILVEKLPALRLFRLAKKFHVTDIVDAMRGDAIKCVSANSRSLLKKLSAVNKIRDFSLKFMGSLDCLMSLYCVFGIKKYIKDHFIDNLVKNIIALSLDEKNLSGGLENMMSILSELKDNGFLIDSHKDKFKLWLQEINDKLHLQEDVSFLPYYLEVAKILAIPADQTNQAIITVVKKIPQVFDLSNFYLEDMKGWLKRCQNIFDDADVFTSFVSRMREGGIALCYQNNITNFLRNMKFLRIGVKGQRFSEMQAAIVQNEYEKIACALVEDVEDCLSLKGGRLADHVSYLQSKCDPVSDRAAFYKIYQGLIKATEFDLHSFCFLIMLDQINKHSIVSVSSKLKDCFYRLLKKADPDCISSDYLRNLREVNQSYFKSEDIDEFISRCESSLAMRNNKVYFFTRNPERNKLNDLDLDFESGLNKMKNN